MNLKYILIALTVSFSAMTQANANYGEMTTKKVSGFEVFCHSESDLFLEEEKNNHKAYNFCTESAVKNVLSEAKKLKTPNFGGDLKLITIKPYINNKPQTQYSIVVVIDEKEKKIIPDQALFANEKYIDKFSTRKSTEPVGKVFSDKNSFMYCFENKNLGYITYNSYYTTDSFDGKYVCGVYQGFSDGKPSFTLILDESYNLFGGKRPEKTKEYELNHRTAKQLMSQ